MDLKVQAKRQLDQDLRKALEERQFRIYYQPMVNVLSRAPVGFEAVMRWEHPERGLIMPAEFIPLARENGLIVSIGEWLLHHACADAATWPSHLKVAINLSADQFDRHRLVENIAAALAASGLEARRLELEITETATVEDSGPVLAALRQLRDMGLGIALDDFGTGYSSLSYLTRFPFSKVKIDRSLVMGLDQGRESDTIIGAVVDLCDRLGMTSTAEGVETEAQLRHLALFKCDEAQGYLFSPPRPASDVPEMLRRLHQPRLAAVAS
jgi:EAL domain-containing protein (putative c-di-GMP-specific phosphodiesterase class I)